MQHFSKKDKIMLTLFLLFEIVLYYLILTTGGRLLVWSSFISIVLCFVFSLFSLKKGNKIITVALAFTVCADYFLVVSSPVKTLAGMLFFMVAQTLYAVMMNQQTKSKKLLFFRIILVVLVQVFTFIILKGKTDALAVVSMYYYTNLAVNIVEAFALLKKNTLFFIGLILLLLCDTIIGLQTSTGAYLNISESSFLYKFIFMDFFISWFFYLPSQVLISLSGVFDGKEY